MTDPAATRNGTTRSNTSLGVTTSSTAPASENTTVGGSQVRMVRECPVTSGPARRAEPNPLPSRATELVTLAARGGMPTASSAGYATSDVMPPAVPMTPATSPALRRNAHSAAPVT
ncbi:hypothetical protein V3W46_08970 [Subtercola sp. YIM 133946]